MRALVASFSATSTQVRQLWQPAPARADPLSSPVLKHKPCNVNVSIKVAHSDKNKMIEDMLAAHSRGHAANGSAQPAAGDATSGLPELVHTGPNASKDGWVTFDKPLMYVFAGKGPHVARDFMQFPVAHPSDGFIDVAAQEIVSYLPFSSVENLDLVLFYN